MLLQKDYCNCPLSKDPLNLKKKFYFDNLNYTTYLVLMTSTGEANNVAQNPATTAAEK